MTIIRNSARCLGCDTEIVSAHVHDFVTCNCGALSVDGGHYYLKRCTSDDVLFEDTSVEEP